MAFRMYCRIIDRLGWELYRTWDLGHQVANRHTQHTGHHCLHLQVKPSSCEFEKKKQNKKNKTLITWKISYMLEGLKQCLLFVNWTLCYKFQWNLNQDTTTENAFDDIVCKMATISLMLYCVNSLRPSDVYMRHQTRPSWVQMIARRLVGIHFH